MIIGIDASKSALEKRTGVENTVYEIILAMNKIQTNHGIFLYTNKRLPAKLKSNPMFLEKYIPAPFFWNKLRLPLALRKDKPEIFFAPSYMLPACAPKKSAIIIHDLAWQKFPAAYSGFQKFMQRKALENAISKAKIIICPSQSTADDLIDASPKVKDRIKVVPFAYNPDLFHPIVHPEKIIETESPFILFAGRLESRKNVARLVSAFYQAKKKSDIPHKLVLAGDPGYGWPEINSVIESEPELKKEIILPGHISYDKMPDLMSAANVFAFATLYEGFGLPVLEAMACGTPVLAANNSATKEVAGDAALLIDAENIEEMTDNLIKICRDSVLRRGLIKAGYDRIKKFSWAKTATEILKILEDL